jgi:hypothetical protein
MSEVSVSPKVVNEVVEDVEEMVSIPKRLLKTSTIVVKPEQVKKDPKPVKEKKPRSEKQLEATKRMRETLLAKREAGTIKYGTVQESPEYKEKLNEAYKVAETLRENGSVVVVKRSSGRPKGVKIVHEAPTPAVYSDNEEDEEPLEVKKKTLKKVLTQSLPSKPKQKSALAPIRELSYIERLNAHLA